MNEITVDPGILRGFTAEIFAAAGMSPADAEIEADVRDEIDVLTDLRQAANPEERAPLCVNSVFFLFVIQLTTLMLN